MDKLPVDRLPSLGETHQVHNVGAEMPDFNAFDTDIALVEAVHREGGGWGAESLSYFGQLTGSAAYRELGFLANRYTPELDTHDRFGNRVDLVRYHDSYHQLMRTSLEHGLHSEPWLAPKPGAHVVRAAKSMMQAGVEAGHGCPITMTFAAVPAIRLQPELAHQFESKILNKSYDPRNLPIDQKHSLTVGMGMTEKQGGSDVRANSTVASPVSESGAGQLYSLVGHKWFLSAPMCDLFLVLANTAAGVSCFLVPRWLPDGSKNPLQVIRLKDKMGNRSNASSEVEFRGALGWLIGEEGRGVPSIIEMVNLTRFDCMGGSTAGMRAGLVHVLHHCSRRRAFGARLIEQPLMRNVLADLLLEYEASVVLTMRMARALDGLHSAVYENPQEKAFARIATAIGKYWICKRGPQHAYEMMECIGGSGVMENSIFPRLFRESVINPIWEGSGNVQCLDVLRAIGKDPMVIEALRAELELARGGNTLYDSHLDRLQQDLAGLFKQSMAEIQFNSRRLVDDLAVALQAGLLIRHSSDTIARAFCETRLAQFGRHNYGTLSSSKDCDQILQKRAGDFI